MIKRRQRDRQRHAVTTREVVDGAVAAQRLHRPRQHGRAAPGHDDVVGAAPPLGEAAHERGALRRSRGLDLESPGQHENGRRP